MSSNMGPFCLVPFCFAVEVWREGEKFTVAAATGTDESARPSFLAALKSQEIELNVGFAMLDAGVVLV